MAGSLTLVAQLDVQQGVDAVHRRTPHQGDRVRAAGGQPAQQGAQVVERHHVLQSHTRAHTQQRHKIRQ